MCLIALALQQHPEYPLILIANRDEFYHRPTTSAAFWQDQPEIFAGRDLEAGGTWLGINRSGRLAALTNVRDGNDNFQGARSRGLLPLDFLKSDLSAQSFMQKLQLQGHIYSGFNLLTLDLKGLLEHSENCGFHFNNKTHKANPLSPGINTLSNGSLNTPWPKTRALHAALANHLTDNHEQNLDSQQLLDLLTNTQQYPDKQLPNTAVSLAWERVLSPLFIHSKGYGTRASTAVLLNRKGEILFREIGFDLNKQISSETEISFMIT